ncbi:MAG TPA: DUF364 domain-containing protein [Sedimentisphaerales bacterium]|nr:DUF364 domain-containing protein [Sedimentisphaerales bacterium]
MGVLDETKAEFGRVCSERTLDLSRVVDIRPLLPHQAIGDAEGDFVIKKGKEYVIEATFEGARGQAFTGRPCRWNGTLQEILSLDLSDAGNRGVFVAALNAALRCLGLATGTIHCRDEDPTNCGPEIAGQLEACFGSRRFGVVGLQPAILQGLTNHFSPQAVRVVDLNPENIGRLKYGVEIRDGSTKLPGLAEWSEVGLATGSSIVNGTIDDIIRCFKDKGKPLVFFGNTISGAAALLGLSRLCPFGR